MKYITVMEQMKNFNDVILELRSAKMDFVVDYITARIGNSAITANPDGTFTVYRNCLFWNGGIISSETETRVGSAERAVKFLIAR